MRLRLCLLQPEWDAASIDRDWTHISDALAEQAAAEAHSVVRAAIGETGIRLISDTGGGTRSPEPLPDRLVGTAAMQGAYVAYEWLRRQDFDIVCAPAESGVLFYALTGRRQNLALQDCTFAVAAGRLRLHSRHLGGEPLRDIDDLAADEMERRTLALADVSTFLTKSAESWARQNGWIVAGPHSHPEAASHSKAQALWTELAGLARRRSTTGATTVGATPVGATPVGATTVQAVLADDRPLVSVCITHFNRPALLRQAIDSIRRQSYGRTEIVVVDDASTAPEAQAALDPLEAELRETGGRLVRHTSNRYLGAARNTAARYARGEYLLFLDDDDCAKPEQVATLVGVACATGADIVNSFCDRLQGDAPPPPGQAAAERWLMLGNAPMVGVLRNLFGPAAALFRKSSFEQLGGFSELHGVGCEDWEIFARASLAGMNLQNVPEALFWYRLSPNSMLQTASAYAGAARVLPHYFAMAPQLLWPILRFANGADAQCQRLQASLDHSEAERRHRDAVIAHRDDLIAHLTRLSEEQADRIAVMSGELAELRSVRQTMLSGYGATPQSAVDAFLHSGCWRAGSGLRALLRCLRGRRTDAAPQVTDWAQAAAVITALQGSITWELTGPLRAVIRMLRLPGA